MIAPLPSERFVIGHEGSLMSGALERISGAEYSIGTEVTCSSKVCGELSRVIIDPVARTLTHLVVAPKDRSGEDHMVPIELVAETGERIRLECSETEFDALESAVETKFLPGPGDLSDYGPGQALAWPYYGLSGMGGIGGAAPGIGARETAQPVTYDRVALGEIDIRRGDPVHARDGNIGRVQGLVIDPRDHHVTHMLLEEGHLWGKKEVAIPITTVTGIGDGIRTNLTTDQVRDLPPVEITHRN
jgi:sporulation protein YlmC with PRC-barrel domain